MNNKLMIDSLNKLMGFHIRVRELHWAVIPNHGLHKIIDDFDSDLLEFIDEIAEDAQSMFGRVNPGELTPQLPGETEFGPLLRSIRVLLAVLKDEMKDKCWTGVINCVDEFWHTVNKNLYLNGYENQ